MRFTEQHLDEVLDDMVERSMGAKTQMCQDEPMTDNPNVVCVGYEGDDYDNAPIVIEMCQFVDGDDPAQQLVETLGMLEVRKFLFVAMMGEGYHREASDVEEAKDYERGDMKSDFENNPASSVKEAIVINAINWTGKNLFSRVVTYVYDDFGVPKFGEVMKTKNPVRPGEVGRMGEVLSLFVKYIKNELARESN